MYNRTICSSNFNIRSGTLLRVQQFFRNQISLISECLLNYKLANLPQDQTDQEDKDDSMN
jgi:hypothetical protein